MIKPESLLARWKIFSETPVPTAEPFNNVSVVQPPGAVCKSRLFDPLVKAPEAEVTEEEIIAACKQRLAGYKVPKKVAFVQELPRTLTGKILKKDLREQFGGI